MSSPLFEALALAVVIGVSKGCSSGAFEEEAVPVMPSASARASSWLLEKAMREDM